VPDSEAIPDKRLEEIFANTVFEEKDRSSRKVGDEPVTTISYKFRL
jgi:hypothetical protein